MSSNSKDFPAILLNLPMIWKDATDPGPRPDNQDRVLTTQPGDPLIDKRGVVLVVCDGVGGELGGRDASEAAATVARSAYYSVPGDDPGAWLVGAISEAHKAVKERAVATGFTGMATTIVMAAVHGGRLYMAHVGDSRAYLLRNGRLEALTRDHSWVNEQAGMFGSEREMRESNMRNVITRSLGSAPNNTPEVAPKKNPVLALPLPPRT